MISGLVMSTTLVNTGVAMLAGDSKESISGENLRDAGGPSINVLTKLTCMFSIVETTEHSWTFFFILMATCLLGLFVFKIGGYFGWRRTRKVAAEPEEDKTDLKQVELEGLNQEEESNGHNRVGI